jgi:hypothetical protein
MNIKPGDFCCVPISGSLGKLVSFGEWLDGSGFTDYDHAEIFVGMADEKGPYGYTLGAYPDGAHLVPLPVQPFDMYDALWSTGHISLTTEQRDAIVISAVKLTGTPYSALDYFALVAHRLHMPVPLLRDYISSTEHMICSQLVDYVYSEAGVHLFTDGRWPGYVTPADLAHVIISDRFA